MQLLDGEHLESRWGPCVRWSWAHPCCLLTSSQLGGLNPHTCMGSTQALWACSTPTSRFNLPSSFIFIKRHLFVRQLTLPKHNHCDSLFFCFSFPVNRFNEFQRRFLCYFVSQLCFPVFKLCSHSLSAESACERSLPADSLRKKLYFTWYALAKYSDIKILQTHPPDLINNPLTFLWHTWRFSVPRCSMQELGHYWLFMLDKIWSHNFF